MNPEHGTGGHARSSAGKDAPQMSLLEGGGEPAVIAGDPVDVSGVCPQPQSISLSMRRWQINGSLRCSFPIDFDDQMGLAGAQTLSRLRR